jgi:acetate kinase
MFCMRAKKYIGAYLAEMGGTDAIVFTGGIGENSPVIRERVCEGLSSLGVALDKKKNHAMTGGKEGTISAQKSSVKTFVIPTNEELLIARDTLRTVKNVPRRW